MKHPLENRIWYAYPGQSGSINGGAYAQPIAVGRVLDDGTTQLRQFSYDTTGYFNLTKMIDPLGRTTNFIYSNADRSCGDHPGHRESGFQTTIAQFTYNYQHLPVIYTDAAGQTTVYGL